MKKANKLVRAFSFAAILIVCLCSASFARDIGYSEDPSKIGIGAAAMGMGGAGVAIADPQSAIFLNPAGLSNLDKWTFSSMYTSLLGDVNYLTASFVYPLHLMKNGSVAVGYLGTGVPGIISTSQSGFTYSDYHNNVVILATSFSPRVGLSFGSSLKLFNQGFSGTTNSIGVGTNADLGAKWDIDRQVSLGVNLQNILPSSVGARIMWPNGDYQEMPAVAKIGIKGLTDDDKLLLALDYDLQLNKTLPGTAHLGGEWRFHPNLVIRGGLDQNLSAATGSVATNLTLGLGLNLSFVRFDYAYHPYFDEPGNTSHYFSLSFSGFPFAAKPAKPKTAQELAEVKAKEKAAAATLEEARMEAIAKAKTERKIEVVSEEVTEQGYITYIIKPGDSLEKISLYFFRSRKAIPILAYYNGIKDPDKIIAGKPIIIPPLTIRMFSDVKPGCLGFNEIGYLGDIGILAGYPDGTFKPYKIITRAEFVKLMESIFLKEKPEIGAKDTGAFSDVPLSHWAAAYILFAKDHGHVIGYPDNTFRPDNRISKAEAQTVIKRMKMEGTINDTKRGSAAKIAFKNIKKKAKK